MRNTLKITLAATATLFLVACGSSSSNTDGTPQVVNTNTNANGVNTYCVSGTSQTSEHCQKQEADAENLGYQPYNSGSGNQGQYGGQQSGPFGSGGMDQSAGLCGCAHGQVPTLINGVMMCASQNTKINQGSVLTLGFEFRERNGRTRMDESYITFDYIEATNTETTITNPIGNNCYNQVQVGCDFRDPYACSGVTDNYGRPVYASCVPVEGKNYGQCVKQTIVQ